MKAQYFDRCAICEKTIYQTPDKTLISHEKFFLCRVCDAAADEVMAGRRAHREAVEAAQEVQR